jgi:hypothetical protein
MKGITMKSKRKSSSKTRLGLKNLKMRADGQALRKVKVIHRKRVLLLQAGVKDTATPQPPHKC